MYFNRFLVSGRECPKLVLVSVRREGEDLIVSAPGMEEELRVPVTSKFENLDSTIRREAMCNQCSCNSIKYM